MQFKLLPKYQPNKTRRFSQPPASFVFFLRCFCIWTLVSPHKEEGVAFGANVTEHRVFYGGAMGDGPHVSPCEWG